MQDTYGRIVLPNMQPHGTFVNAPLDFIEPIGFGPLAPNWPTRRDRLSQHSLLFSMQSLSSAPLPDGFNYSFFNAAPQDQWLDTIRGNEHIILENLHREHSRLVTGLPVVRPRVFVERRGGGPQPIEMRGDTLLIDTDRGVCSLVFRGLVPLASVDERGRVLIAMEQGSNTLTYSDIEQLAQGRSKENTNPAVRLPANILLSTAVGDGTHTLTAPMEPSASAPAMLPFAQVAPSAFADDRSAPRVTQGLPFTSPPSASAEPALGPSMPPLPPRQPLSSQAASVPAASPQNVSSPPLFIAESAVQSPATPPAEIVSPWASGGPRREDAPTPVGAPTPLLSPEKAEGPGVLKMSNSAAEKSDWRAPRPEAAASSSSGAIHSSVARISGRTAGPRDALSLLWFDGSSVHRLRKHKGFRELLENAESRPPDAELEELSLGKTPAELEDHRDVFEILARASSIDAQGVIEALERSMRDDGKVLPPLVVCGGELQMPFDDVERLKATVATMTPLSSSDENLKAALQIAKEFLALPNLSSAPAVAEGLVKRIHDAFGLSKRAVTVDYIESQVERALLEQRHYQRRKVFGGKHLRGLLATFGGAKDPIPSYLPEALTEELPMYACFRVRLVAEVRMAEDQYESHSAALRVLALGRVVERFRR
jgi:hypothetical protein